MEEQVHLAGKNRYEEKSLRAIKKESKRNCQTVKSTWIVKIGTRAESLEKNEQKDLSR